MNDTQLTIFIEIADRGSFSKAEEHCHISKQALLKQMNSLEKEMNCQLLERTRTGIVLTKAGELFYHGAKRLLSNKENLVRRCQEASQQNILRIGSVEHQVLLNPVTEAYQKLYPEVRIERIVHPNHSGEYRVSHGLMDVGETFVSDQRDPDSNYSFTSLRAFPYEAAVSKHHPLASKKQVSLKDLVQYPTIILPMMLMKAYTEEIRRAFAHHKPNLFERNDVDNQVEIAFSCINSNQVLITANPFIHSVKELKTIPLDTGWVREYGIIYLSPVSTPVRNYIDLALSVYNRQGY